MNKKLVKRSDLFRGCVLILIFTVFIFTQYGIVKYWKYINVESCERTSCNPTTNISTGCYDYNCPVGVGVGKVGMGVLFVIIIIFLIIILSEIHDYFV